MTVLLPWEPPDGIEALAIWLTEIGETRANRPPGTVFPYYMVTETPGTDDKITYHGVYQVHSFAMSTPDGTSGLVNAMNAARLAARRVLAMGPPLMPQALITLTSGQIVQCDGVETKLSPHYQQFTEDASIERIVAEYDIDWRFIAAV